MGIYLVDSLCESESHIVGILQVCIAYVSNSEIDKLIGNWYFMRSVRTLVKELSVKLLVTFLPRLLLWHLTDRDP